LSFAGGINDDIRPADMSFDLWKLLQASKSINALAAYSKGFAFAYGLGVVFLFERTADRLEYFKKTREIWVSNIVDDVMF